MLLARNCLINKTKTAIVPDALPVFTHGLYISSMRARLETLVEKNKV